jgi:hypothetical protein
MDMDKDYYWEIFMRFTNPRAWVGPLPFAMI